MIKRFVRLPDGGLIHRDSVKGLDCYVSEACSRNGVVVPESAQFRITVDSSQQFMTFQFRTFGEAKQAQADFEIALAEAFAESD